MNINKLKAMNENERMAWIVNASNKDLGIVLKNEDLDIICITCKCLVDTVINDLTYKVVKTLNTCVSNIHGWTLAYSLQSFQHLNMAGIVVVLNF